MSRIGWVLVLGLSSCVQPAAVTCDDGRVCPSGMQCTPTGCATPADIAACAGVDDGTPCTSESGAGICVDGACEIGQCGNGVVDPGEVCDDGNRDSGDGCRVDCAKLEQCGDLYIDDGEVCDDGNENPVDGCSACAETAWHATPIVGAPVLATSDALAMPRGIAYDLQGRLHIADYQRNLVTRIEMDGTRTIVAGTGELGGFTTVESGRQATGTALYFPFDIAIDGLGRVHIAEAYIVRRVELDGTLTTIAGTGGPGGAGDGGPAARAEVYNPSGIAVDALGRVVIADTWNHKIRRVELDGTIVTIAGTGDPGESTGQALQSLLRLPTDVAIAADGDILVADGNRRICRIDTSPPSVENYLLTTEVDLPSGFGNLALQIAIATDGSLAIADGEQFVVRKLAPDGSLSLIGGSTTDETFSGDGGPASAARFRRPSGIAIDPQGRVAIADEDTARIRRLTSLAPSATIDTIAGGALAIGDGSAATSIDLLDAHRIAIDAQGRILIAERGANRIRRIELDGTATTVAGAGTGGRGDNGPAIGAFIYHPTAVVADANGVLYIAEEYRVRKVDAGGTITTIAGTGLPGPCNGGPALTCPISPISLALDKQGRLLIGDYEHVVWRLEGTSLVRFAGTGTDATSGDGLQAAQAAFQYPGGLAVDAMGRVYIADAIASRVRRVGLDGVISTIAGTGVSGYRPGDEGAIATAAQLASPEGIAIDSQGRVLLAELLSPRVRRIDTDGTIRTLAGTGSVVFQHDGGAASGAGFQQPRSVVVDASDRVYVLDSESFGQNPSRVRRIDAGPTPRIVTIAGRAEPPELGPALRGRLANPLAVAAGDAGTLFVAGGRSGTVARLAAGRIASVAGRYPHDVATEMLARFRSRFFGEVGGVAFDSAARLLYVSEAFTSTSSQLEPAHGVHTVDASAADANSWTITKLVGAEPGYADGPAADARVRSPTGLWLATGNRLLVADTGNHAIRAFDLGARTMSTLVNVDHAFGFAGDGGPAAQARLFSPRAVTQCPNGDIFIADTGNHRVRRIANGTITTVIGDGAQASSGEGEPANAFSLDTPLGLACDRLGNLYVAAGKVVRGLAADANGVVDGSGPVRTIYGKPPRTQFPASTAACLAGIALVGDFKLVVADACTGIAVEVAIAP